MVTMTEESFEHLKALVDRQNEVIEKLINDTQSLSFLMDRHNRLLQELKQQIHDSVDKNE
jgi:hypothetical protein